jgi:hypothetical protein
MADRIDAIRTRLERRVHRNIIEVGESIELSAMKAIAGATDADTAYLLGEVERLTEALTRIAGHPCPNRDCCCGPAPTDDSMGRIARMALGRPELVEEATP